MPLNRHPCKYTTARFANNHCLKRGQQPSKPTTIPTCDRAAALCFLGLDVEGLLPDKADVGGSQALTRDRRRRCDLRTAAQNFNGAGECTVKNLHETQLHSRAHRTTYYCRRLELQAPTTLFIG